MVKVVNNNGSWKRQDNGEDVSNIPFSGVFPSTTNLPRHLPTSRCPANIKPTNNQPCSIAPFHQCFHRLRSLSGEIALADSFNISNDDSSAYSLINSLGEPLNAGNAILGTFSSGTWSYDVTTSRWNFQGNSYAQDQLKYSDLMSMQNNFTSALTNIPEEQNGGVADGRFNLSGDYSSSLTSPVYLMVTGQDGETALLSLKTYPATVCLITII